MQLILLADGDVIKNLISFVSLIFFDELNSDYFSRIFSLELISQFGKFFFYIK